MKRTLIAVCLITSLLILGGQTSFGLSSGNRRPQPQDLATMSNDSRSLVALVKDAAYRVQTRGEAAFVDLRVPGSRWRQGEIYIFVLDPQGNMLVHSDPGMEGKNHMSLKDINGKPIIRGLIDAATTIPDKREGWYHYEWPVPGGLLPRWKSSYVQLVVAPSGKRYVVGSGMYSDHMERAFVVDRVKDAVGLIEKSGKAAFTRFHDRTGPFIAKDAYVFVIDTKGVDLVNPGFPSLEGRNLMELKDTQGNKLIRDMFEVAQTKGSGWVDYMWPKPGESVSTQKSTFVSKARMGDQWVLVGCGVYLADAPKAVQIGKKMTAPELMGLVRDAASVTEQNGEKAYPEFRTKGSRWFRDDTYVFVWSLDGTRVFHAADPSMEGRNVNGVKDVLGRPYGKMFLDAAATPSGEGWVHYMYPEPGDIFPTWKSAFVKRATFPSGKQYLIGCGIYNMQMDRSFIEDVVNRAAARVAEHGKEAFSELRDKTGPYRFMDTYVFVNTPNGIELVNPAQPSLEGKNLLDVRDATGKAMVQEYIAAAMRDGSAWVEYYWYRPGSSTPTRKLAYVRKVQSGPDTYVIGSGFYPGEETKVSDIRKTSWSEIEKERLSEGLSRQMISGDKGTVAQFSVKAGCAVARHSHPNEEYLLMSSGAVEFTFGDRELVVRAGEVLVIPANIAHSIVAREDSAFVEFFAPVREDWLRGEDQYLRK